MEENSADLNSSTSSSSTQASDNSAMQSEEEVTREEENSSRRQYDIMEDDIAVIASTSKSSTLSSGSEQTVCPSPILPIPVNKPSTSKLPIPRKETFYERIRRVQGRISCFGQVRYEQYNSTLYVIDRMTDQPIDRVYNRLTPNKSEI